LVAIKIYNGIRGLGDSNQGGWLPPDPKSRGPFVYIKPTQGFVYDVLKIKGWWKKCD